MWSSSLGDGSFVALIRSTADPSLNGKDPRGPVEYRDEQMDLRKRRPALLNVEAPAHTTMWNACPGLGSTMSLKRRPKSNLWARVASSKTSLVRTYTSLAVLLPGLVYKWEILLYLPRSLAHPPFGRAYVDGTPRALKRGA
jgi:hypothetical protein